LATQAGGRKGNADGREAGLHYFRSGQAGGRSRFLIKTKSGGIVRATSWGSRGPKETGDKKS